MKYIVIVFFLFCLFPPRFNDYLFLGGWVMTIILIASILKTNRFRYNIIDILILIYCLFDLISIITGYKINVVTANFVNTYLITLFYFICRLYLSSFNNAKQLLYNLFVVTSALIISASINIYSILIGLENLNLNTYISEFKFLMMPLGMQLNNWATFAIFILFIQCLNLYIYRNNNIFLVPILAIHILTISILVNTFIRGVYICLIIYYIFMIYNFLSSNYSKKCKLILCICLTSIIALSSSLFYGDVQKTLKIVETESQIRSLEGRFSSAINGFELFVKNPLMGNGSATYCYAMNSNNIADNSVLFSGNIISELLIEKGVVGLIVTMLLIILPIIILIKYRGDNLILKKIYIIAFVIIVLRELTFPSIISTPSSLTIFILLLALFPCFFDNIRILTFSNLKIIAIAPLLVLSAFASYHLYNLHRDNLLYTESLAYIEAGEIKEAEEKLCKAKYSMGGRMNLSIFYWNQYKSTLDNAYLQKCKDMLLSCIKRIPDDYILHYNLSKILEAEGDIKARDSILHYLINNFSNKELVKIHIASKEKFNHRHISDILLNNPRLIYSEQFGSMFDEKEVKDIIRIDMSEYSYNDDPINLAKSGKLLMWADGDTLQAKVRLENAINILPNLIEPRFNLSIIEDKLKNNQKRDIYIKQYNFITKQDQKKNVKASTISYVDDIYHNYYYLWYGIQHLPSGVIFY